jgi:putative DNA primase/helicase
MAKCPWLSLKARLQAIVVGSRSDVPNSNLRILAADNCEAGINLGSVHGQQALEAHLDGIDLLVIDNLSTLTSGSEGASDAWLPMQNWLLRLRRRGVAVLLVHHAGVNGRQRGTSRREDALDTVIALRRPTDYSVEQGARFEIYIEKARTLVGEGALPFEARAEPFATENGTGGISWLAQDLKPPVLMRAAELFAAGHTVRQVAVLLGLSRSEAGRLRQQAVARGLFGDGGEDDGDEMETAAESQLAVN